MKMRTLTILCATAALLVAPGLTAVSGAAAPSTGVTSKTGEPALGLARPPRRRRSRLQGAVRHARCCTLRGPPAAAPSRATSSTPTGPRSSTASSRCSATAPEARPPSSARTTPTSRPRTAWPLTKAEAKRVVSGSIGTAGAWSNTLRLDPSSGRLFYQVESMRTDSRPVRWVDARSGAVMKAYNAIAHGDGTGVLGDEKSFESELVDGTYQLRSFDDNGSPRRVTLPGHPGRPEQEVRHRPGHDRQRRPLGPRRAELPQPRPARRGGRPLLRRMSSTTSTRRRSAGQHRRRGHADQSVGALLATTTATPSGTAYR